MTNDYYNGGSETAHTLARSSAENADRAAVAAGFDRLPAEAVLKQGRVTYGTDTGTANAYLVALPHAPASYTAGLAVAFKPANTNTGASTINVDSLGVKNIKRRGGVALAAGDIDANAVVELRYDGTEFQLLNVIATTDATLPLSVANGGTGASTAESARAGLAVPGLADDNTLSGTLSFTPATLAIATGSITGTSTHIVVEPETGSSDVLSTLVATNYGEGALVCLRSGAGKTIRIDTAGNFAEPCLLRAKTPTWFVLIDGTWYLGAAPGQMVLVDELVLSGAATADLVHGIGGGEYDYYLLEPVDLGPDDDGESIQLQIAKDVLPTIESGATDYELTRQARATSGNDLAASASSQGTTLITLANQVSNVAGERLGGAVEIFNPAAGPVFLAWELSGGNNSAPMLPVEYVGMGAYNGTTNAVRALRLTASTGNLSGTLRLLARHKGR